MPAYAVLAEVTDRPGILSGLTRVLADVDGVVAEIVAVAARLARRAA